MQLSQQDLVIPCAAQRPYGAPQTRGFGRTFHQQSDPGTAPHHEECCGASGM